MSDPKRATLITVGAPKSAKSNVKKTVRLTINLDESNESKYPELNYKELVIAEERKKRVENGKTAGLDPFSDNDEDVQRVARKFEQKYGGKSTYGRKGRSKIDDFADIGAGYDESDSFIDNTHGYDEMIPPECDTLYGGFYINCGSLEFKSVPDNQTSTSDGEPGGNRRNKRRISSSSSEEESSESSSDSESQDEKEPKAIANGAVDSHETEHRKKKNKKVEKKKAKKIRRADSSAATSGKQTSDDNAQGDGESADSRTSQSDSLTSKPAPSSENAITSDSSRDVEPKVEVQLQNQVLQVVEALEGAVSKQLMENPNISAKELFSKTEQWIIRMEHTLCKCEAKPVVRRSAWSRAAAALSTTRSKLLQQVRACLDSAPNEPDTDSVAPPAETPAQATLNTATVTSSTATATHKRKQEDDSEEDFSRLTDDEREAKILETLLRLKTLIDDRKPGMIANYNAECERVQEERKKIQQQSAAEGAPMIEKRLPKRRFPWCARTRALLSRLRRLAPPHPDAAARLLATRVLPLFPAGFVRMPTLLRQADLSKDIKVSEIKRQRLGSSSQPTMLQSTTPAFTEPIQFPSSLTVTTTTTTKMLSDKPEVPLNADDTKYKPIVFNSMLNSYNLSKDLVVEKPEKKDSEKKEDVYVPPNNIGSITITPVPNQIKADKKSSSSNDKGFIRVKSPAALNEMVNKKDKQKKEKNHVKEKSVDTPLHIDTNLQSKEISKKAEISQKLIESMRVSENNIPRPALVPVQHSPTFAKPDKRPPEAKKKKDIVIVSDVDPLGDNIPEPLAIDDSSSDVEVVEEKTDKSEKHSEVPSKDKNMHKKVLNNKVKGVSKATEKKADADETTKEDIDALLRDIREMASSQDPSMKMNSNSYSGVITNAKHEKSSMHGYARGAVYTDTRSDRDKFAEPASLRRTDGCNNVSGANTSAVKMIKS